MAEKKETKKRSTDLDAVIGERIRIRRILMNITQNDLAKFLDVTFQQVQKYEKGKNRVSAVALYNIAKKLCVPIEYFFGNGPLDKGIKPTLNATVLADSVVDDEYSTENANSEKSEESVELLKSYYQIEDKNVRKHIQCLINDLRTI